jgi:UDP-3-O-[3-hydroxymyristoyl] glucosamine N-acyltransferase
MMINLIKADPELFSILRKEKRFDVDRLNVIELDTTDGFNYDITRLHNFEGDFYFFGNSNYHNHSRLAVFAEIVKLGVRPKPFVSERALVGDDVDFGMSTVVYPNSVIDSQVRVGFNSLIMPNAVINKSVKIANNVYVGLGAAIGEGSSIAANAFIGEAVRIAKNIKVGKNVIIRDPIYITEDVPDGVIIDSNIGEYVRLFN